MRALLTLLALLLIAAPAVAQENMTDEGMDGVESQSGTPEDDSFDVMPFVVLIAFSAVVFLLAKYGP